MESQRGKCECPVARFANFVFWIPVLFRTLRACRTRLGYDPLGGHTVTVLVLSTHRALDIMKIILHSFVY